MTLIKLEGLNIYISKLKLQRQSGFVVVLLKLLLIVVILLLLPILFLIVLFSTLFNLLTKSKSSFNTSPTWLGVAAPHNLEIEYKWVKSDEVPKNLQELYEDRGLMIFKTNPHIEFFEGYFTDFKVERDDGIFVQKVIFDINLQNIQSAPLYFFKFSNLELEKIVDLYGFEFDSKGKPDDFIVSAYGKDGNFEVRLTK